MLEITVLYVTGWNQRPTPGKQNTLVRFQRDINYTRGIFAQTIGWSFSRPVSSSAGIGSSLRLSVGGWLVGRTSMCDDVEPEIDFLLLPCDWESSMTCDDMIRWAKQTLTIMIFGYFLTKFQLNILIIWMTVLVSKRHGQPVAYSWTE